MVFSSPIFLFLFLPIVLAGCLLPTLSGLILKYTNVLLLHFVDGVVWNWHAATQPFSYHIVSLAPE
jgi:hypothetical protein